MQFLKSCLLITAIAFTCALFSGCVQTLCEGEACNISIPLPIDINYKTPGETPEDNNNNQFSFVVYGDTRGIGNPENAKDYELHRKLVSLIDARNPDFILNVGDMVNHGCEEDQWNNFLDIVKDICRSKDNKVRCDQSQTYLDTVYYPIIGNHEMIDSCSEQYFSVFPFLREERYYSFSHKNAYFIILDSSDKSEIADVESGQHKWLEKELETAKEYYFRFVFFHMPVYAPNLSGGNATEQEVWAPLFKEHNIDIVFSGDHHVYARFIVDGATYVITGGGGAPLHEIETDKYIVRAEEIYHYVLVTINNSKAVYEVFDENYMLVESFDT